MTLWNFLVINRGVFRTLPNIYDGAFLSEDLTAYFRKKGCIMNDRLGCKCIYDSVTKSIMTEATTIGIP